MTHDKNLDTNLRDILLSIRNELSRNSRNNTNYTQHIEKLKQYLQDNKKIALNQELFQLVILKQINVWETKVSQEAIYYLLSHYIKNRSVNTEDKTLSFKDVIDCLRTCLEST